MVGMAERPVGFAGGVSGSTHQTVEELGWRRWKNNKFLRLANRFHPAEDVFDTLFGALNLLGGNRIRSHQKRFWRLHTLGAAAFGDAFAAA